jgi:hypothetical protein
VIFSWKADLKFQEAASVRPLPAFSGFEKPESPRIKSRRCLPPASSTTTFAQSQDRKHQNIGGGSNRQPATGIEYISASHLRGSRRSEKYKCNSGLVHERPTLLKFFPLVLIQNLL